jgi:ABC-2 type transport system permease protein
MIRKYVVRAVARRNFGAYFRSPTGYVFIAVFILLAAVLAFWPDGFWANNLDNLDVLNRFFPYLLLFFVPAIAMSTWADERKQGTDELLLTLPATDLELVLGKYLAAVGIYAASLLFSLTYIFVLVYLGSPDYGVVLGTYLGYFFLGAALLSISMFSSLLTSSTTVAFILGALFCVVPIFLGSASTVIPWKRPAGWLEGLGVDDAFAEFTSGVVSIRSIVYFVSLTVLWLYLNLMLLSRRHTQRADLWLHRAARALSILVIAISLGVLTGRAGVRADVTQERLHSLAPATRDVIRRIDSSRPVVVQAFVSPVVPTEYVETRTALLALLRDMTSLSGGGIQVQIVDTEPASAQAREADERFGIKEHSVSIRDEGESTGEEIFMGVAFTCAGEEVVIPFIEAHAPIEYELTRSIGTVSGLKRRKVGIASTDAKMLGGFDFQSMSSQGEWGIVTELRKQYEVVQVSVDQPVTEKLDCLIVGMPSSLTQPQMDNLLAYLRQGNAALLFDDPWPEFSRGQLAPDAPKPGPGGRNNMFGGPPPGEPKGDLYRFMDGIGLRWPSELIVGDHWNHHRQMQDLPNEIVFIGPGSGNREAFNPNEPTSAKLQEMAFLFPGFIEPRSDLSSIAFTPLLSTSFQSASIPRSQVITRNPFGMGYSLNPRRNYIPGGKPLTLAARVEGTFPPPPHPPTPPEKPAKVKLIFVADLDCISDLFFRLRASRDRDLDFDNIAFVLNSVDGLVGDDSYIELRKRRPKLRTLSAVEELDKKHVQKASDDEKKAEDDAKKELEEAKKRLDDAVEEIKKRTDVDLSTKQNMVVEVEEQEKRRFEMKEKEINDKKKGAIKRSETDKKEAVKSIRKNIKILAVLLPPIPAILVALIIFVQRVAQPKRAA